MWNQFQYKSDSQSRSRLHTETETPHLLDANNGIHDSKELHIADAVSRCRRIGGTMIGSWQRQCKSIHWLLTSSQKCNFVKKTHTNKRMNRQTWHDITWHNITKHAIQYTSNQIQFWFTSLRYIPFYSSFDSFYSSTVVVPVLRVLRLVLRLFFYSSSTVLRLR